MSDQWQEDLATVIEAKWNGWADEEFAEQEFGVGTGVLRRHLLDAIEKALPKRHGGEAPIDVHQRGEMEIGVTVDGYVCVQFKDPYWWLHLTAHEARNMAKILLAKAIDVDPIGERPNIFAGPSK